MKKISSAESKLKNLLISRSKDLGITFEQSYVINGKEFDFAIFKDNKLTALIEIDGEYHHALKSDADGYLVHNYLDCKRFQKVPDGVKFIVADSRNIELLITELCAILNNPYSEWIDSIFQELKGTDFPFPSYTNDRMLGDYKRLRGSYTISPNGRLCDSIISNFHKSIYYAHKQGKPSPVEAWSNEALLRKNIENRFIYKSNLSSQNIASGFNISKIAPKVSVFSASVSKYLIQTYLNEYTTVFDPFSGFSGRMLGTVSLDKTYIGSDINSTHVAESNSIIDFLRSNDYTINATVITRDIFDYPQTEFDCLFTCSPYSLKEQWNEHEYNHSCDEWIDICLSKFKCKRYLFVVDYTEKYKNNVVDYINNRYHFNNTNELVVLIDNSNSFNIPQLHENVIKLLKSIDSRGSIQKKSQLEREILSIEKEELKKAREEQKRYFHEVVLPNRRDKILNSNVDLMKFGYMENLIKSTGLTKKVLADTLKIFNIPHFNKWEYKQQNISLKESQKQHGEKYRQDIKDSYLADKEKILNSGVDLQLSGYLHKVANITNLSRFRIVQVLNHFGIPRYVKGKGVITP